MWQVSDDVVAKLLERMSGMSFPSSELFERPSKPVLHELLRVAFAASLTTEEARPTTFNLAYLSAGGAQPVLDFALDTALPCDVEHVRRLAPILDGPFSFLVVEQRNGSLVIVGGVRCVQLLDPHTRQVPAGLLIAASGPAQLALSLGGDQLLLTAGGEVWWTPRGVSQNLSLYRLIDRALGLDAEGGLASREAPSLLRLARAMLDHRHGGTILVVGAGTAGDGLRHRFSTSSEQSVLRRSFIDEEALESPGPPHTAEACETVLFPRRQFEEALRSVARLTAVDGAVVLGSDLALHGFGAIIEGDPADEPVLKECGFAADGSLTPTASDVHRGGTRHRSAARFVHQNRGSSLAFVASQDGVLSLWVGCEDETVVVVRPIGPPAHARE